MSQEQGNKKITDAQAPLLERLLFGNRVLILVLFAIFTAIMGFQASKLTMGASFEKMIPTYHPYIKNYFKHKIDLKGLGNVVRILVENIPQKIFLKDRESTYISMNQNLARDLNINIDLYIVNYFIS